jgi:hypothetical protein
MSDLKLVMSLQSCNAVLHNIRHDFSGGLFTLPYSLQHCQTFQRAQFHSFIDYEPHGTKGVLVPQRSYSLPRGQTATFRPLPPIRFSINGVLGFPLGNALQFPIRGVLDMADTIPVLSQRANRVQLRINVSFFRSYCYGFA